MAENENKPTSGDESDSEKEGPTQDIERPAKPDSETEQEVAEPIKPEKEPPAPANAKKKHSAKTPQNTECQNCGATLKGAYCHQCGQAAKEPRRVVIGLVQDVIVETLAIDGKLARTIALLVSRPGKLARRYPRWKARTLFTAIAPLSICQRLFLFRSLLGC